MQLGIPGVALDVLPDEDIVKNYMLATQGLTSETVTSISGGKTSSYMFVNYPTKYSVFACVLTRDPNCRITDKGLLTAIRNKIPEFEGSRELDQTLINVLELEQLTGRKIDWVWNSTYEDIINARKYLPNQRVRFCTEELKMIPIFNWYKSKIGIENVCEMNIGFRIDESKRVYKILGGRYSKSKGWDWEKLGTCEKLPKSQKHIQWRFPQAPLWLDRVDKFDVAKYWIDKGWVFPRVSNCDFCFFHRKEEHVYQQKEHPTRSIWWIEQENILSEKKGKEITFHKEMTMHDIVHGSATPLFNDDDPCACTD